MDAGREVAGEVPRVELYGVHKNLGMEPGRLTICKGPAMAGALSFNIIVRGRGSHAAMPQESRDALLIASGLVRQIQSIVSRNVDPFDACVISVTQIHAGAAYNVMPEEARLAGTIRYFCDEIRELAEERLDALCKGAALGFGVEVELDCCNIFDVLENDLELSDAYMQAAADVLVPDAVAESDRPLTGSEDFADMLKAVPGSYCILGHSGNVALHNPGFALGAEILPTGAAICTCIVESGLA